MPAPKEGSLLAPWSRSGDPDGDADAIAPSILRPVTPTFPAVAGQAVVVAAALLALGYLIADSALRRSDVDTLTRWALAFPALVGWALALMVAHMLTGGAVLSNALLVRGLTGGLAAVLVADKVLRRHRAPSAGRAAGLAAAALVGLSLAVWGAPLLGVFPLGRAAGDTGWHTGWTQQLLNGLSTPTASITGDVPNYYPWLFHGLLALVTRITPGGTAFHGLGPVQLLQVAAGALALFALGRELARRLLAGVSVAVMATLAAGLGAVAYAFPALLERTPQVGGPRLTYNGTFHALAPALPRDVAFTLLIAFVLLACIGLVRGHRGWLIAAGACLGLTGLVSAEAFFIGLAVAVVLCVAPGATRRTVRAAAMLGPALGLWALWLVPLAASYARLGGFVTTTRLDAPSPSGLETLLSWGWAVPLGLYGLMRSLPRAWRDPRATVPAALLLAALLTVAASAAIPALLGEGFLVLGRARRYWPIVHLGVAVYAGLGAADLLERAARAGWALAALAVAALLALTVPITARVSFGLDDVTPRSPQTEGGIAGDRGSVVGLVRASGEGPCVVAAPNRFSIPVFSVTGYRLVDYSGRQASRPDNPARIRWRDIYETVTPHARRAADNPVMVEGLRDATAVRALLVSYGVDVLVTEPEAPAVAGAYRGLRQVGTSADGYHVYRVGACG